ncbi:MAG: glycoside hydrolase family 127 protein, partial [Clostridiales bacterium]|nr:glycoside hydrolase family 127 protein [Clostridiales bacterium]
RGSLPSRFDSEKKSPGFTAVWDKADGPVNLEYHQAHLHPRDQDTAVGHAVRAMYLYSAMADLAAEDDNLLSACKKLYANVTKRQMYITGGVGSTPSGEAFTHDYDLPPDTAYGETCAAIGLMMFAKRMGDVTGEAKYYDTVERALYNGVLSGVSLSGREFFYVNPLSVHPGAINPERSHVKPVRQAWFPCACCPPHLSRTLLSLADYAVRISESAAYVNLFISGEYESGGKKVKIETQYPYSGKVIVTAWGGRFALKIRVPGQSRYQEEFRVWNGEATVLEFDVSPRILFSHPKLSYTRGMAAMCAGPLAYCAEEAGNSDSPDFFRISPDSVFELAETPKEFPAETKAYKTKASKLIYSDSSSLYTQEPPIIEEADLVLVPYHLWGNRGLGDMRVWLALE